MQQRTGLIMVLLLGLSAMPERSQCANAATAGPITAAEMASWCEPYRKAVIKGDSISVAPGPATELCYGAFLAIQQLSATTVSAPTDSILRICAPPQATPLSFVKTFLAYSDAHPEQAQERFAGIALKALWAAYPCAASELPKK
jgi:hypothetical protein